MVLRGSVRLVLAVLKLSLALAIQLDDSVLQGGRGGTDVVLLSVAYMQQAAIFPNDNGLLRRIAYVETRDGFLMDHNSTSGGIWAVREEAFTKTQTISDSDFVVKRRHINATFGVDWEAVQWSELNKPFYSALAARLVLFTVSRNIPIDTEDQAQFWKHHYNTDGSEEKFLRSVQIIAQGDVQESSGSDFFIGFLRNYNNNTEYHLFITTKEPNPVPFYIETLLDYNKTGVAVNNSTNKIMLPGKFSKIGSGKMRHGIHISSGDKQIIVCGRAYRSGSSDAFLALPYVRSSVNEYIYYAVTYRVSFKKSEILVVASEDNTTITLRYKDVFLNISLNKMETYLYKSVDDLTGTRVVSNKPISFYSGNECTRVPLSNGDCDHLTEQFPSTTRWGNSFLSAPLFGRQSGDRYRVVASQPSTNVTFTCSTASQPAISTSYPLTSPGDWEEIETDTGTFCAIKSNNPVLLVQYMLGYTVDGIIGDPALMMVPAIEQYTNNYVFPRVSGFRFNALSVFVTPEYYQPDMIYIDDVSQEGADWTIINCTDNSICGYATYADWSVSTHRLYHRNESARIGALVYGGGRSISYAYQGGLHSKELVPVVSFTQERYSVREDEGVLTVSVERSGTIEGRVLVLIATRHTEGTATAEQDFSIVTKIIYLESRIDVNISIINDESIEGNETFTIYLTSDVGVNVSPYVQTEVTIIDDEECECINGGYCIQHGDDVTCTCPVGYTGDMCEVIRTECDINPCLNGGSCTLYEDSFICTCPVGYTGDKCEVIRTECDVNPCVNGGSCTPYEDSFTCTCPVGYTGDKCEVTHTECDVNPCLNGGSCTPHEDSFTCTCPVGYTGDKCEVTRTECDVNPCVNGGSCTQHGDNVTCTCPVGVTGDNCEDVLPPKECEENKCLNGGSCTQYRDGYKCSCSAGFTGDTCENKITSLECEVNPCVNGGSCTQHEDNVTCICPVGYTGDMCEEEILPPKECEENKCLNGGSCTQNTDGYICSCSAGFTGDTCEIKNAESDSSRSSPPMLFAIVVGIIVLLFLVMLTTAVVMIYVCLKKKKRRKKMILKKVEKDNVKEDKMKDDDVKEDNVEHIYETIREFRSIQALHDPKHSIETTNPLALDVDMLSNAAYDVVGMQSNMAYGVLRRELQLNVGRDTTTMDL